MALAAALLGPALGLCAPAPDTPPTEPPFAFAVFGDSRPGNDGPYSPVMLAIAKDMAQFEPLLVLGTGDYIQGSESEARLRWQYSGFFTALEPLQARGRVPVMLAPGNHDIGQSRRHQAIFEEYFKRRYFSHDVHGVHFIVLDSEEVGQEGRIAGKQLSWLKADLSAHRGARLTFVALHRPLYPVDGHVGSSMDAHPRDRDALHSLFVARGVDGVFAGHEHLFNRQEKDGITYVITAGAGAPAYAPPKQGGFFHYVLVEVVGDRYQIVLRKPGAH